jgi:hypothetical protein
MKFVATKKLFAVTVLVSASFMSHAHAATGGVTSGHDPLAGALALANNICAAGADVQALVNGAALTANDKAIALGEAARQIAAGNGQCNASQSAIDAALAALKAGMANGGVELQAAYDGQKNSGSKDSGNGVAGLNALGARQIGSTVVGSGTGAEVSPE